MIYDYDYFSNKGYLNPYNAPDFKVNLGLGANPRNYNSPLILPSQNNNSTDNTNFNVNLGRFASDYWANSNSEDNSEGSNNGENNNTENNGNDKKANALGAVRAGIGTALSTPAGQKILDTFDPVHAMADGKESSVGNALSSAGNSIFSSSAAMGNGWGMLAGAGVKILGGLTNTFFGSKLNKNNINTVKNNIAGMHTATNSLAKATDTSSIMDSWNRANMGFDFTNNFIGKDGPFAHKARKLAASLRNQQNVARGSMMHELSYSADKANKLQSDNIASRSAAYGGSLNMLSDNMGATEYGLMSDYITMRNNQAQSKDSATGYLGNLPNMFDKGGSIHIDKNKEGTFKAAADRRGISMSELADRIKANPENYSPALRKKANFYNNFARHKKSDGGNLLIGNNGDTLFALGGDMQTNGGDYSDGLKEINAGKSHEENPYQGVQMGVAPDGSPNLVEEGETIFNDEDYVFSNRIHPKKEVLKKFHMYSKGGKLTYADVSKRLEKEAKERPNDPISKASLKDMLTMLMDAQEQQKAEEEAKEAKKAFEALSPEEQKAVLEQIAQQQQAQANAEQQANPQEEQEVPVDENGNPIEQTEEMPNQEDIAQNDEGSMNAYGGSLHKFPDGGSFKNKLISALGFPTLSDFNKWAEENNVDFDDIDWDAIEKNPLSMNFDIIAKRNPALADALKNNYDFGAYTPSTNGYDLAAFAKALNSYTKSKIKGHTSGNYAIDKDFGLGNYKTIEDLENSEAYKNYTNALVNIANAAQGQKFKLNNGVLENIDGQNFSDANLQLLNTLYNTTQGTSTFDKGKPVPMFVDNGDGTYSIAKNAKDLLIGTDGKSGLRYDHKGGIFHLTPTATTRGAKVVSRVINDDGTIEDIIGDVPTAWGKPVNTYSWNDPENSYTYNYYKRPATDANGNAVDNKETKLPYKNEKWRYAGLLGPAIGLGLWSAGVGKPNTKGLDAAMEYASQANGKADYMPIGDYLRYNPMDIWAQENRNDANARATDRAIVNNNTTAGSKMAGLLANGYNSQIADANLFRQAQEYNDAQRQKVAEFNRGTNMFNADAYNKTSQTNAELQNRNAQFRANLAAQIANQKMNADSNWYNALYGNIGELANGLSEYGRENAQYNMIAAMANNGVFGTPASEWGHYSGTKKDERTPKNKASKGGKLKRRKGLTF